MRCLPVTILLGLAPLLLGNSCLADESPAAAFSSVEQNLRVMDKDHDGMVTVFEVRAYIESLHGKDYRKDVLDEMESSASGKSCSTPFAKRLYR